MTSLAVILTVVGAVLYITGGVVFLRLLARGAQAAAVDPDREAAITQKTSRDIALVLAPSTAALGVALGAKDIISGDATYLAVLLVGLPLLVLCVMYVSSRWIYLPHEVFRRRIASRGAVLGGWSLYDYEVACTNCGGASENLRAEMADVNSQIAWKCRACGHLNVLGPGGDRA